MSRDLEPAMEAAVGGNYLRPIWFFEFAFDGATLRLFSGTGQITWNSENYTGAGNLLSVDHAEETSEIEARGCLFRMTGIPETILSLALTEEYQGRPARIFLGALDDSRQIIADPVQTFSGEMDVITITDDPNSPVVGLTAESELVALRRSKERRYTPEDQKMDFPDDDGFDFVPVLQDKELRWGK